MPRWCVCAAVVAARRVVGDARAHAAVLARLPRAPLPARSPELRACARPQGSPPPPHFRAALPSVRTGLPMGQAPLAERATAAPMVLHCTQRAVAGRRRPWAAGAVAGVRDGARVDARRRVHVLLGVGAGRDRPRKAQPQARRAHPPAHATHTHARTRACMHTHKNTHTYTHTRARARSEARGPSIAFSPTRPVAA